MHAGVADTVANTLVPAAIPPPWILKLPLADGSEVVVTPPMGARMPRPLVLAIHGMRSRPEFVCGGWRLATLEYPFIVCPHGNPDKPGVLPSSDTGGNVGFRWESAEQIERRAILAIDAVRQHFAGYVADGPVVYAGTSQGAYLAE